MEVYVFGAGASVPYGAPTMSRFLPKAFEPWNLIPPEGIHFDGELRIVAEAIDREYGIDLANNAQRGGDYFSPEAAVVLEKVNIERLLAMADENDDAELRTALERVIFNTLELSIRDGPRSKEYELLLSQLLASGKKACLISFNYDLLLDRALVDAAHTGKFSWTYCVPFNAGIENFPSYHNPLDPRIHLLKLHGSLNWCQCVGCGSLRLYYFKRYDDIFRITWPDCHSCQASNRFRPVLVAPTPSKHFPNALKAAWDTAANCLTRAEKLIIIGYSFPAFDQKVRDLFLKDFIVPNLRSNRRPKLAIANRDQCVRKDIKSWFLPAVDSNVDEYCSFEEYCQRLRY